MYAGLVLLHLLGLVSNRCCLSFRLCLLNLEVNAINLDYRPLLLRHYDGVGVSCCGWDHRWAQFKRRVLDELVRNRNPDRARVVDRTDRPFVALTMDVFNGSIRLSI